MHPLVEEINRLVQELQGKMDRLQEIVNSGLSRIPWGLGWVADKIHDAWNALLEKWNDFWDKATLLFGNMGDPGSLSATGTSWTGDVGRPVTEQAGTISETLLAADNHWTGDAAAAYLPRAALQRSAMEAIESSFVQSASSALDTVKSGLLKFYTSLVAALITLVAGFISAAASSATIIGIPAGIFIAVGAILIAAGAFYTGGVLLKSDCTSAKGQLSRGTSGASAFPGGAWPPGAVLTP
ncbi:hypothetical protein GCM10027020_13720 [Nocardioides salsibiostraticola]